MAAFRARGVKYLIVGGYAVDFHAQPRFTKDIDLFVKAEPRNAQAVYDALASFGARLNNVSPQKAGRGPSSGPRGRGRH